MVLIQGQFCLPTPGYLWQYVRTFDYHCWKREVATSNWWGDSREVAKYPTMYNYNKPSNYELSRLGENEIA